jgi:hypothetical protein
MPKKRRKKRKERSGGAFVDGKTFFLVISFFSPQFFDTLGTHAWPRFKSLNIVKNTPKTKKNHVTWH